MQDYLSNDSGKFGSWITDSFNLPAYLYTCKQDLDPNAYTNTICGPSNDHWHLVGNDCLSVFAHNYGTVDLLYPFKGLEYYVKEDIPSGRIGGGIGLLKVENQWYTNVYSNQYSVDEYKRIFGCGYFQKSLSQKDFIWEQNIFPLFFSEKALISEHWITNQTNQSLTLELYDVWGINYKNLFLTPFYLNKKRKHFIENPFINPLLRLYNGMMSLFKMDTESRRKRLGKGYLDGDYDYLADNAIAYFPSSWGKRDIPKEGFHKSAKYYPYPASILMMTLSDVEFKAIFGSEALLSEVPLDFLLTEQSHPSFKKKLFKRQPVLSYKYTLTLSPKQKIRLSFLLGLTHKNNHKELVNRYNGINKNNDIQLEPVISSYKNRILHFNIPQEPKLSREVQWHSYYTLASTYTLDYFENRVFPQGSSYEIYHGTMGAIRDFILFALPYSLIDPDRMWETIEIGLRLQKPAGDFYYATFGYGSCSSMMVHESPSDLPLFMLWGISEYLYATRDYSIMEKMVPFHPKENGKQASVKDRILLIFNYIQNKLMNGEHLLFKIGTGDWSDPLTFMVKNRKNFVKKGESTFNSALGLYVLPRLIPIFERFFNDQVKDLRQMIAKLKEAVQKTWNGEWFYRGYDGSGDAVGDKNLFLEHHPFIIASDILQKETLNKLIRSINENLIQSQHAGIRILHPPIKTPWNLFPYGMDVNGGVWAVINQLYLWSLSSLEGIYPGLEELFKKCSMSARAKAYPDIWYGIWTGPDAFNSDICKYPGETFRHISTPMTLFPAVNLNYHAPTLYTALSLAGVFIQTYGIRVKLDCIWKEFEINTGKLQLKRTANYLEGTFSYKMKDQIQILFEIPKNMQAKAVSLTFNNKTYEFKGKPGNGGGNITLTDFTDEVRFKAEWH